MPKISLVRTIISVLPAFLVSAPAMAHVKWFIPAEHSLDAGFVHYSFTDVAVLVWIGIGLVLIAASVVLDSRLPSLPIVDSKARKDIVSVLRVCTGMSLLLTAYDGALVAPHYQPEGGLGVTLLFMEGLIGLLFISNRGVFYGSIMLLILYCGVIFQFGFIETIEYWNIIGIAIFLLFNNFKNNRYQEIFKPYSVSALRIFTGIALITLGLSEKLIGAEYGEAFIAEYDWNFMFNLGFENFSDRLFVLSAGVMEVVFGLILILGTTTRLNILVVSGFMLTSNITFLVQGNNPAALMELIGHLPIIATAVICVFFGYGQRLKVTSLFKEKIEPLQVRSELD